MGMADKEGGWGVCVYRLTRMVRGTFFPRLVLKTDPRVEYFVLKDFFNQNQQTMCVCVRPTQDPLQSRSMQQKVKFHQLQKFSTASTSSLNCRYFETMNKMWRDAPPPYFFTCGKDIAKPKIQRLGSISETWIGRERKFWDLFCKGKVMKL